VFFAIRRRRRTQRLEHESAVQAALAAVGFNRKALDEDYDDGAAVGRIRLGSGDAEMSQPSNSRPGTAPSAGRSSGYMDSGPDEPHPPNAFNPYADYFSGPEFARNGYLPARPNSPPLGAARTHAHVPSNSAGSNEPLLAGYHRSSISPTPQSPNSNDPPTPPRNSQRISSQNPGTPIPTPDSPTLGRAVSTHSSTSNYSTDSIIADDRLDPGLRQRMKNGETASIISFGPRDDEDYSRPVLGVSNYIFSC
jgi:hypothetical protein